jgi:hypothetical protein
MILVATAPPIVNIKAFRANNPPVVPPILGTDATDAADELKCKKTGREDQPLRRP